MSADKAGKLTSEHGVSAPLIIVAVLVVLAGATLFMAILLLAAAFGSTSSSSSSGSTAGPAYTGPCVDNPNTATAYAYFVAKGLTNFQSAGILGNLCAESGVNPEREEIGCSQEIGPCGYGIAQWSFGRKDTLKSRAGYKTLVVQLDFLWEEMKNNINAFKFDSFRATTNVDDATEYFMKKFESPRDQSVAKVQARQAISRAILAKYSAT